MKSDCTTCNCMVWLFSKVGPGIGLSRYIGIANLRQNGGRRLLETVDFSALSWVGDWLSYIPYIYVMRPTCFPVLLMIRSFKWVDVMYLSQVSENTGGPKAPSSNELLVTNRTICSNGLYQGPWLMASIFPLKLLTFIKLS